MQELSLGHFYPVIMMSSIDDRLMTTPLSVYELQYKSLSSFKTTHDNRRDSGRQKSPMDDQWMINKLKVSFSSFSDQ